MDKTNFMLLAYIQHTETNVDVDYGFLDESR